MLETEIKIPTSGQKMTPLMQQYWEVKSAHPDKIILFRMGDFFEMFHRDAEIAAPILGIALTSRNKKAQDETRMCGVPHHSIAPSINKLLSQGFKIAICDQIEDPKFAKGLVKRAVTRILSPGVVFDPETLNAFQPNYLASFDPQSLSFLDTTTGEAFYFLMQDEAKRRRLIASLRPVEIVLPSDTIPSEPFDFAPTLSPHDELIVDADPSLPASARRLLSYAATMQGAKILSSILPFVRRDIQDRMALSQTVVRQLEIFETYRGETQGSLFQAINRCQTSPGARKLKDWLLFPLATVESIENRQNAVELWRNRPAELKRLRQAFANLGDISRRLGKLSSPSCHPRDLQALAESLEAGLQVCEHASKDRWNDTEVQSAQFIAREIARTIAEELPAQLKFGGFIRSGVSQELDELQTLSADSNRLLLELENREREATGISSLKVRFNNVFGYYIEVTNAHKDKIPIDRYDRKQTLANAERYLTKELAELEAKVLTAQGKRVELENEIFQVLKDRALAESRKLLSLANQWAELDVISSLAWIAIEQDYCRPQFSLERSMRLTASRHPVIEQVLREPFVANDIELNSSGVLLLTGPNMAGKSTLMRQVAIAAIMAQVGSFVAAKTASLPLFSQIFTRIGASDFLTEGLSTFMVEMKESAEMLAQTNENSLVILDEIGRGTSTFDGMSLAQAILEFLLRERRSMTFFATHYHELTTIAERFPQVRNAHMSIHEKRGKSGVEIAFLHQLTVGAAQKSYGIHVGKLAGLPEQVTKRAASLLKDLESRQDQDSSYASGQMSLLSMIDDTHLTASEASVAHSNPKQDEICGEIRKIAFDQLTPLAALNQIAEWQRRLS